MKVNDIFTEDMDNGYKLYVDQKEIADVRGMDNLRVFFGNMLNRTTHHMDVMKLINELIIKGEYEFPSFTIKMVVY